jgi:hypothetical protein
MEETIRCDVINRQTETTRETTARKTDRTPSTPRGKHNAYHEVSFALLNGLLAVRCALFVVLQVLFQLRVLGRQLLQLLCPCGRFLLQSVLQQTVAGDAQGLGEWRQHDVFHLNSQGNHAEGHGIESKPTNRVHACMHACTYAIRTRAITALSISLST